MPNILLVEMILFSRCPCCGTVALFLVVFAGCRGVENSPHHLEEKDERQTEWFEEVSSDWGIHFVHSPGKIGRYFMPESIGSGAAIFDYDNDGMLDIYLLQNAGPGDSADKVDLNGQNQLFRQIAPSKFENVSSGSGANVRGYGMGVVAGDINNDGWNDLFITEYGGVRLLINQANGKFLDVTQSAGLENKQWGTSACFVDYDRDGWLDIVVANYVDYEVTRECFDRSGAREYCGPSGFPPSIPRIFRNRSQESNSVRFDDVTVSSGLAAVPGPGLGVVAADFDGDGWQDIFFADDAAANRLFINKRNGTFADQALTRGIAFNAMGQTQANMGIAIGDADGNGLFDIFVTHLNTEAHALWKQGPQGLFRDASGETGVTQTEWRGTGFGTLFGDFDRDGLLDLAVVNGGIKRAKSQKLMADLGAHWSPYAERNQLLKNCGKGRFKDRSTFETSFCGTPAVSRGLACADIDGDGSLDLLVTDISGPIRIYKNITSNKGHWLIVRAIDPELGGRDAFGATVSVKAGNLSATRILNPSYSFLCSGDARCHFGLGPNSDVAFIKVIWPDGNEEYFQGGSVDQVLTLRKGHGLSSVVLSQD